MKNFNLTQMLQGCSRRNEMAVSASNSGGGQTCQVKQQTRLMSEDEKWSEKEALSSTCLRNASVIPPFCFRYVAMIFAVLTLSIANIGMAWADDPDRGFWSDDGAYVRFYRNNTYEYSCTVDGTGQGDYDLGNIDSDGGLYWTDLWAKTWYKDMFESVTFYWRVKGRDAGEGPDYSNYGLGWRHDFESGGKWHGYWDQASKSETCSTTGLAAGNYEVEFFWAAYGKDKKTYYLSNGGSNYHANFTLRRKITYNTDGSTAGTAPSTEWWDGAATVRDNTGLLRRSDGKVFAGWADSKARADAGNIDHEPGQSNMSVTLTADLDLYPVWRDGYYLITPGATSFNLYPTAPFLTTSTATGTSITVNGVNFSSKCWQAGSGAKVVDVTYAEGNHIVYDTQTDNEDIFVYVKGTGNLHYVIFKEGVAYTADASDTVTIGSEKVFKFSIVHSKKSRLVIGFNGTTPKVANIKVVKHGSALAAPCTPGYQLSFPGRAGTAKNGTIDGITLVGNSNLTFGKGNVFQPKTQNSHYAQFTTTATAVQLQVTTTDNDNFYVCTDKSSPTTTGVTLGGSDATHSANLQPSTTYYIVPNGNQVEITKIAFASCASFTATRGGQSSGSYTVGGYDGSALTCTPSVKGFYTYQWKQNTSNSKVGAVNAVGTGANTASFTPNPASAGTYYYYCVATNGCSSAQETTLSGAFTFSEACSAPTSPSISGTTAYSAGGNIELTASATGTDGETTYQWYKGDPENGGVSQGDASTSGATFTKASCVVGDAGTYYCVISNGEGCTVTTYQAITVSCLTAPSAVTSLTNSAHTATSLTYTWTKATNASGYTATLYSDEDCEVSVEAKALGDVATATFSDLTPSVTYYCKVQSKGNGTVYCEDGGTTSEVSGTTDAPSTPTFSPTSGTTVSGSQSITITGHSGSTVYYAWATSAQSASDIYNSGSGSHGTADAGTASTPVQSGKTLYAISRLSGVNSSVSSASYTVDATAPTLSSSVPANSATGVNTSGTIVLTFSEALGSVDGSKFTLTNATKGDVAIDGSDNKKVNIAYSGASYSTTVTLASAAGAVADAVGNTSAALSSISFTTKAEPTLTALEADTKYEAADMASNGSSWTGSDTWFAGLSSNTKFKTYGNGTSTSAKGKTVSSTSITDDISSKSFTSVAYIMEADNVSSTTDPTKGAIEFITPSTSGKLYIYTNNASSKLVIRKKDNTSTTSLNAAYKAVDVDANTHYFILNNGGNSNREIYGIQYVSTYSVSITSTNVTKASGATGSGKAIKGKAYTATFTANDGYELPDDVTVTIGGNSATKGTEYTWTESDGTATLTVKAANVTGNIVVSVTGVSSGYAITNADPSNGTIDITDEDENDITSAEEGVTVNIKATPADGYRFTNWSVKGDTSGDDIDLTGTNPATFTMPDEAVTVSATFSPNTYTITYNLNGASWAGEYSAPAEYTVGMGATLPVAGNMSNTGYTFDGWFDNSGLTGSAVTEISTSDYGNKEFWAKWTENTYTITYDQNDVSATGSTAATEGHYVTVADCGFELADNLFAEWNTESDGSGESYHPDEDIELTANMTLYAIWATDYTITWGNVQIGGAGATVKPNIGGGNYTITANTGSWTGSLDASMISTETSGVTITNVAVDNSSSPKTITVTFAVGAEVVGESIGLTLSVPAAGVYSAKSDTKAIAVDACTGSSSGSDGVLFSAEFKDSGLGSSNVCSELNTPYTFTTSELKSAAVGGTISAYATGDLNRVKYDKNVVKLTSGDGGVIHIHLNNEINTNDLFTFLNTNGSSSNAYLRHTSADNTTGQITLAGYGSEKKVMLPAAFNGATDLYIVRNSADFKLHKAAVVRPAFLMLLRDDTPTSTTNLSGTDQELTTLNYLTTIQGGHAYYTSPSSGNLQIIQNSSKNYIKFSNVAGYVKIVLDNALEEGDVIGFDAHNTDNLALTVTAERSTSITTTNQLYTVGSSSPLKDKTTFYLWQNSGAGNNLRGLQVARSGAVGGGGGTDQITTTLTWDENLSGGLDVETGASDFTHTVTQDKNSLGAITYSSSNTSVATVTAGGKVHIVGAAGDATITATMAASGCYKEATASYVIRVTDNCSDTPGTITARDLECEGTELTVSGHTALAGVSYQWYKDGVTMGVGYTAAKCTVTVAGEYYVVVTNTGDGHCAMASDNTVVVEGRDAVTAEKIVDEWYVKKGRRTPDIALVQTTGASGFTVTSGGTPVENIGGCTFELKDDGIIYLHGQQDDGSIPGDMTAGDMTISITATGCGGEADPLEITIKKQAATPQPSVAFVVDGTEKGTFAQANADHSTNSPLYSFLDNGGDGRMFILTAQNIYSSVDEKEIRQHFSQFDAIIITDDPNTGKTKDGKSYVDAFGTMIDVRPILTMEAYVSKLANWKVKGINGNPESPNPRQYAMKLQCKDHAIFTGLDPASSNVDVETVDGVDYWTVKMVDKTKSPYSSKASDTDDTGGTPALQGFSASDVSGLLLLGEIINGDKIMYTGIERQEEPAARLMLLGLNNKALPNALTEEGKTIILNALFYLLQTDMEHVDDCSTYFTGASSTDWNDPDNWSKGIVPNDPTVKARILTECVVSGGTFKVAEVDIAIGGVSSSWDYYGTKKNCNGILTINPTGSLIVGGKVRSAIAPYFNTGDLMPTEPEDLVVETNGSNQGALILNNDAGDTKATVNLYSLGRKEGGSYQFQYMAVPMNYVNVSESFAGSDIYTYVWLESAGWERRGYYTELYAFEGVGITTKIAESSHAYTMSGNLASTATQKITLTNSTKGGLNLIGNSWTAPIQIGSLAEDNTDANITKTVYIYCTGNDGGSAHSGTTETAGQWLAIPFEAAEFADWTGLKVIPAMQAFEIKVTEEATLTLDYNKLVRGSTNDLNAKLRAPRRNEVAETTLSLIRVSDSKTHTDLSLFESERFSEAFDNGWEAELKEGNGWSATLYAETETGHMAVAAMEDYEGTIVGFKPGTESEYTYSFIGADNGYYLNDLKTHRSVRISEGETYTFTTEEGDAVSRFYISRTAIDAQEIATGVTDLDAEAPKVQKVIYNDKLFIIRGGKVFSADGQIVR